MHTFTTDKAGWHVESLIKASKNLEIREIELEKIEIDEETKRYLEADLNYPIILSEHGYIMDGYHRLAKALLLGIKTIKVVQFKSDPCPDFIPNGNE